MTWRIITVLMVLLGASPCRADIPFATTFAPNQLCRTAINAAERAYNLPPHLLAAIGRVESGRKDSVSGEFQPWPWTVNAEGQGSFYDTKAQAIAAVQTMRAQGMRSIDVGCMQISLLHHPDAFASLEQAFDPGMNADYGGRFLNQLHDKTNSWPKAVELYHSATPEIGAEYGQRVYAALPLEQRLAGLIPADGLASAWSATINRPAFAGIFRPSPARVITLPSQALGAMAPGRTLDSYRAAPIRLTFARGP